ncbi:TetR/AcrR family transcriptional regulator [Actinacidiphila acididurans]|uniref:TetR/AcrR family transcriptional regulator n=1 Tax=Actinacidiphila acididurans TaxID=2784346 RepID=A0ABS2TN37_9ACTN|nr:TetR/AcrR family transcriptional regulator [Actinacidiphila acididurans]MBM9504232.1 TetR/AcrR family transcriptional regulator [Actinacidiphila acididurans]
MGRTSNAREKILGAARSLMAQRGYSALGTAEICKAAGVPKGSFYYFFESKEALGLAVLDEHWAMQRKDWERVLTGDGAPLDRLRLLFEETEAGQRAGQESCGTVLGCMFGNLSLELSNHTEVIRGRLQEIFDAQVDMVQEVVAQARQRAEITAEDTRDAARAVVAQLEGQVLFAKLYNDSTRLNVMWRNCLAILGAKASGETAGVA